jgi:predicted RNA-binding protein with PUA-like domain
LKYWLLKSEPSEYSIDDLARDRTTSWEGVRNYQARNFMREMQAGDKVLFYASSSDPSGVTGVAEVSREARPEPKDAMWSMVEIRFVEKFPHIIPLEVLKKKRGLEKMVLVKRGTRLSVQPVTKGEFEIVLNIGRRAED